MIKIALFGCGRIGTVHLTNILQHEALVLAGIVDPNQVQVEKISRRWKVPILSEAEVFQDRSIDAVLIASTSNTHIPLIEKGLEAGKHILCEKPIDVDFARVKMIVQKIASSRSSGSIFGLGFNRRFDPSISQLKKRLDQKEIGRLENLTIISRDPSPPPLEYIKISGGMFCDMTIHDFDLARWITGEEMSRVYARGNVKVSQEIKQVGDIDNAVVHLETASGLFIQIINSRRSVYGYDQRIEAFGSEGMLRVENHLASSLEKYTLQVTSDRPVYFFLERYEKAYQNELNQFVEAILNQTSFLIDHQDGLKALELAEKALILYKRDVRLTFVRKIYLPVLSALKRGRLRQVRSSLLR